MSRPEILFLEHRGKRQSLKEWSRETGVPYTTIRNRTRRKLESDDVLAPVTWYNERPGRGDALMIEFRGETKALRKWSDILGISYPTLYRRLTVQKLPPEIAFTLPLRNNRKIK